MQNLEPIPNYGTLIPLSEFKEDVERGAFIDYDGMGHYATLSGMDGSFYVYPSDIKGKEDPRSEGFDYVVWFNK